jgi:hypothetical protein
MTDHALVGLLMAIDGRHRAPRGAGSDWEPTEHTYPDGLGSAEWVAELLRLLRQCPAAYSDKFGGFYTLTRYADACQAAPNHSIFRRRRFGQRRSV